MRVEAISEISIRVALDTDQEFKVQAGTKDNVETIQAHVISANFHRYEGEEGRWLLTATGTRFRKDGVLGSRSARFTIAWDDVPWSVRVAIRDHITALGFPPPVWAT